MAKYHSSTFGKISGKHGSAVAVIRKDGSTYLRLYVPASNPRTDKQQAHRAKFALTSKSLVPFNPIFKETIGVTNGISTARSYAFKNAIVGEYPSLSVDYQKLMFSFGALEKLHNPSVVINKSSLTASWTFQKMNKCHCDDSVSLVVFNKNANQAVHLKDVAIRSDKEVKIDIYNDWAYCDLYAWAYLTNGDEISDSVFVVENEMDCNSQGVDSELIGEDISICNSSDYLKYDSNVDAHSQNVDGNLRNSTLSDVFNKVLSSFIVMTYSLFGLLKQSVKVDSVKGFVHKMSNNSFCIADIIDSKFDNVYLRKAYEHGVSSFLKRLLLRFYGQFSVVFAPHTGLIMMS